MICIVTASSLLSACWDGENIGCLSMSAGHHRWSFGKKGSDVGELGCSWLQKGDAASRKRAQEWTFLRGREYTTSMALYKPRGYTAFGRTESEHNKDGSHLRILHVALLVLSRHSPLLVIGKNIEAL